MTASLPWYWVTLAWLVLVMAFELRTGLIPQILTLGAFFGALVTAFGTHQIGVHVLGALAGVILGLTLYRREMIGGGTTKTIFAVGALLGPLAPVLSVVFVLAGFYTLARLRRKRDSQGWSPSSPFLIAAVGAALAITLLRVPE